MTGGVHAAVARVGQNRLPAAAIRLRPAVLVEIAAEDRLGAERRAAEQLAAGGQVDQVEDLAAVRRVEAYQQLR
jgi:acetyl-CoA carboxylase beta subunit